MQPKIALDPEHQSNLLKGLLALAIPQAYAAYEAPEHARGDVMREALKWTVLGGLPAAALASPSSRLPASMVAGAASGIKGADNAIQGAKSKARTQRTHALIEALSNKFVPMKVRNEIDKAGSMNRSLFHTLVKVALARKLANDDDPHGLRRAAGGAVGAAAGMPAVPGGQLIGSQLGEALANYMGKGMVDRARWAAHGGTLGGAVPPAVMALLMSRML